MPQDSPILILDSGLGGLTVARAIRQLLPEENLIYFGDTARLPYGAKSAQTVSQFVRQIITYALPMRPKHVVIACNTATALAMPAMQRDFPDLPISGVVDPGARAAVEAAGAKPVPIIGILATEATIRSGAYERAIVRRRSQARLLLQPAPLLAPIVEDGRREDDPLVRLALKQYLRPLVKRRMDVLVLGCTHYPIYKSLMQRMLGEAIPVIDSARQCAQDVRRRLQARGQLRTSSGREVEIRCFVTDESPRFEAVASRFLGESLPRPTCVSPEALFVLERDRFAARWNESITAGAAESAQSPVSTSPEPWDADEEAHQSNFADHGGHAPGDGGVRVAAADAA